MIQKKRILLALIIITALGAMAVVVRPVVHLAIVWWNDPTEHIQNGQAGTNDASRMNPTKPLEVIIASETPAEAEGQIASLLARASRENLKVTVSGARHSMGGHTLYPGAIVLDMLPLRGLSLDSKKDILRAGAGARWSEIIPYLDRQGLAVNVMQSNNDFTVGGSVSVNCHGWQSHSPPISSTIESFRIATTDGKVLQCSRKENPELFSLVLGGYGLFGIILDVDLHVVKNEFYRAESHSVVPANYAEAYMELTKSRDDIGMDYGRISVAPESFLREGVITLLKRQNFTRSTKDTLTDEKPALIKRLVFRGSVGSDYGKNLRWRLEKLVGETAGQILSRNQIMNEPSDWFANRDPKSTEILHEYFVPPDQLVTFLEKARTILLRNHSDLLNITVREVQTDHDTFLPYAREQVFGLVMLFHQGMDEASEAAMQVLSGELIDAAIACKGTYYLPYRPHATLKQFTEAYPMAQRFFAMKSQYDPGSIFQNQFFLNYGKPTLALHRETVDKKTLLP